MVGQFCLPHLRANNLFDIVLAMKEVAESLSLLALLLEYLVSILLIYSARMVWLGHTTKLFACYVGFVHTLSESTGGATGVLFSGSLNTCSLIISKLT